MKMVKNLGEGSYFVDAEYDFSNTVIIEHPDIKLTVEKINDALIDRRYPVLFSKKCINKSIGNNEQDEEHMVHIAWGGGDIFRLGFNKVSDPNKIWYHSGNLVEMMYLFNKWTCKEEEADEWSNY